MTPQDTQICSTLGATEILAFFFLSCLATYTRPNNRHIQYFSLLHLFWIVLILKMGVILSFVVILFLWERGLSKGISDY